MLRRTHNPGEVDLRSSIVATLIGVAALQLHGLGQSPAPAPGQPAPGQPSSSQPTFRAGTTVVEVSAIVTRDGRPVADLRADEVTVLDNGVAQPLVAFEYVDLGQVSGPAQRRDFVILMDNLHIDPTRTSQTIDTALALIDRLGPHDRVAVATTGLPDEPFDFTTDREAARAFVRGIRGQQAFQKSTIPGEREFAARSAMERLANLTAELRSDAERRSILLISEGHPTLGAAAETKRNDSNNGYVEFLDVIRQAALANVAIYTVDPRGLRAPGMVSVASREMSPQTFPVVAMSSSWTDDVQGSLAVLALNTGGIQTRWTNDLTADLDRMIDDSRHYYRIAYAQPDPPAGKKQPSTRSIKVKVERKGVDVRARQRYAPIAAPSS